MLGFCVCENISESESFCSSDMNQKKLARWSFWIGAVIVLTTHVYMLVAGLPASQMMGYAILNLIAEALVIFGWMKR